MNTRVPLVFPVLCALAIASTLLLAPLAVEADSAVPAAIAAYNRGLAHSKAGRFDDAIREYSDAIRSDANFFEAYNNRGNAYNNTGRHELALADFDAVIRLKPHPYGYNGRGEAYRYLGQYDRALEDYAQALRLDPAYATALNNQAWVFATARDARHRDGRRAVEVALKACELSKWARASHIDTLAAAQAAVGNFAEAVFYQEKALAIGGLTDAQREKARARLELYRQGVAYRE
jgi:tetratricopeptide (TPR) repeat protein